MSGVVRSVAGFAVGAIGFALGGPLGFAGASLAFGLLFPAKAPKQQGFGGSLEINTSEFDGPIPVFWGTMGAVGGNIINVGKNKKGEPAGVLVKKSKKKVGGKGGGGEQEVEEKKYFLVAEYSIGMSGDGGPLYIDKIVMEDSDGTKVHWDRDSEDDTEENEFEYTAEYSAGGTLIAEHLDYLNGRKITMQLGTEEQQPLAFLEEFWGAGNVCPHRGVATVGFDRIKIFGQPTFIFTVRSATTGRREIIKARLQACGIPDERISLTQIDGDVEGAAILGREPARDFCEKLASRVMCGFAFNNARVEDYSKLNPYIWTLEDSDLAARESAGARDTGSRGSREIHNKTPFEMKGEEEFQSEVSASFFDLDHNYEENSAIAPRYSARHSNPQSYDLPEAARLGDVLAWARTMLDEDWAADRTLEVSVLPAHCQMQTGNVMRVPHRNSSGGLTSLDYLITEQGVHPSGLLTFRGVPWQSGLHEQVGNISESDWPVPTFDDLGKVYFQIFDCAPLHDSHTARPGFYVIANWPDDVPGVAFTPTTAGTGLISAYSGANGSGNTFPARGTFGVAEGALGAFSGDVSDDWDNSTLILKLRGEDGVEDETDAAITGGYVNMLRVGDEIIQFVHATYLNEVSDGAGGVWHRYEISRFKRARRATEWAMSTHVAGEEVTLLDTALLRVDLASWAIGQNHAYQLVYDPERGSGVIDTAFTCNGRSLKPFSSRSLDAVTSGDDWLISFTPRTRFMGWEINPSMPILTAPPDSDSYLVEILNDSNNVVRTLGATGTGNLFATYSASEQIEDFGSVQTTLNVRVVRLSSVTTPEAIGGRGYEVTGTFGAGSGTPTGLNIYQSSSAPLQVSFAGSGEITASWNNGTAQTRTITLSGSKKNNSFTFAPGTTDHVVSFSGDLDTVTLLDIPDGSNVTRLDGVAACSALERLISDQNRLTSLSGLDALTALQELDLSNNQLSQATIEAQIDAVYANRVALGAAGCELRWGDNPGSSGAATSRATEIADLITAGCSVNI